MDEAGEVVRVEACKLSPVFEAVLVLRMTDEVHGHVFDDGHVLGAVTGSQSGEIIVEDDVENPMQAILDPPMGAHGGGEGFWVEHGRGQVKAPLAPCVSAVFDSGLDHGDGVEGRKPPLIRKAAA